MVRSRVDPLTGTQDTEGTTGRLGCVIPTVKTSLHVQADLLWVNY